MSKDEQELNVEQYEFEPIKGYPMLNWKGKRPFRSTQYYPAQLKETHGEMVDGWLNKIFWGDNLQVMSHLLKEYRGKIKLIYIDPPFDSKAEYKKTIKTKGKSVKNDQNSFEEKQYNDLWNNDQYLQFMYERILLMRELLTDDGTLYLHCDSHRMHYLRCILDEIFGYENCVNVITWQRSLAHGDTGQGAKHFGRVCDYIFIYSKTENHVFNPQYKAYSDEVIERDYKYFDENNERYRLVPVDGPGGAAKGNPFYEFLGVAGYWRYSKKKMQELYEAGEIVLSSTGKTLSRKKYLKDAKGISVTDLWNDINRVSPTSNERINYPTQKPEKLLERIIKTSSNVGDIILDCFMGSGTTQAVALKNGRKFLGTDINLGAVQTTTKRLIKISNENKNKFPGLEVYNVNNYEIFRNPIQAKELLIEALEIQPIHNNAFYDGEKDGRMVKIMSVNRIATKADLNELITNFDYKLFEKRQKEYPNQPVEKLLLVCMGHEPELAAALEQEVGYKLDVEVVDILRDKSNLEFKRDSEAEVVVEGGKITVKNFYPMNLLQKLSIMKENVEDWTELVESVMIDWNYDGAVLEPTVVDIPAKNEQVAGTYEIPEDAGTIRIKITDLLSESFEVNINNG
ncbi:site-specific DNA-methyltransferase [Alkalihalobacterium elongatum]|uniref:site-specific DNA-methyltransferase n=1 Tax=Alkalihalobacterium elongatum TaxID=2675466 RepID=UPI001F1AB56E|nr:site-specific DNA-methyltransferase [Alkalihalobacterium elongatum]